MVTNHMGMWESLWGNTSVHWFGVGLDIFFPLIQRVYLHYIHEPYSHMPAIRQQRLFIEYQIDDYEANEGNGY